MGEPGEDGPRERDLDLELGVRCIPGGQSPGGGGGPGLVAGSLWMEEMGESGFENMWSSMEIEGSEGG